MTQSQPVQPTGAARRAAYRRLALTILGLDVPTVAARLQSTRQQPVTLGDRRQPVQAA